jgi:hypothetical protein
MLTALMRALIGALVIGALALAGPVQAAKYYVETKLGELTAEQRAKIETPRPVQLIFQFTTDQKANPRATKYLKEQVFKLVRESGAFSAVAETPVEGGAMLVVTIDNIVQKDAAAQGFKAGLTFGLAKAAVRDGYLIVADYTPAAGAPAIRREVTHGLWVTMGSKEAPEAGLALVKNITIGVETVVRQGVGHAVNQVALDPGFVAVAAPAPSSDAAPAQVQPGA